MLLASSLIALSLTTYPTYGDKVGVVPKRAVYMPKVEAAVDRGLIVELHVKCGGGIAIISYSKIDKAFCTPKLACGKSLVSAVERTCPRH